MFRYFQYTRKTVGGQVYDLIVTHGVEAHIFSFGGADDFMVSITGSGAAIDAMLAVQPVEISIKEIKMDAFALSAESSDQVGRIRERAAELLEREMKIISDKYPKEERDTWSIQIAEAEAYQDTHDDLRAQMLKMLAEADGVSLETFASNVLAKK
ncbi:MAG: hypothetical protein JXK05_04120 [Campylobacterales bacterium]|nr:hypothetical protein [Campylobacterales bacterium]